MSTRIRVRVSSVDGSDTVGISVVIVTDRRTTVPPLRVPERFRTGILRVAELPEDQFDELLESLQKAPTCQHSRELLAWIADETPAITEKDRQEIIPTLASMLRVQRNAGQTPIAFATGAWEFLSGSTTDTNNLDQQVFISRIASLLELSSLDLASFRIGDVKQEVERNFCKVRVMTDLRPAFDQGTPTDMAVIHNLQVGYHDGMGKHKEFYISLDAQDLQALKKAILDAEEKADNLETFFQKSGIKLHK